MKPKRILIKTTQGTFTLLPKDEESVRNSHLPESLRVQAVQLLVVGDIPKITVQAGSAVDPEDSKGSTPNSICSTAAVPVPGSAQCPANTKN